MLTIKLDKRRLDTRLHTLDKAVEDARDLAVEVIGAELLRRVRFTIGEPSLGATPDEHYRRLAAIGHPYARRHGAIKEGFEDVIHVVTGTLYNSLTIERVGKSGVRIVSDDPKLEMVVEGDEFTLGRPFFDWVKNHPSTYEVLLDISEKALRSALQHG